MTTAQKQPFPSTSSYPSDNYDPEDVGLRDSPLLQPIRPNLNPSPSPPPMVPLPEVSPDCSPDPSGRKGSNRPKNRPSLGDAVLVHFMDGGKHLDISRKAGDEPLASENEDAEESVNGVDVDLTAEEEEYLVKQRESTMDKEETMKEQGDLSLEKDSTHMGRDGMHLAALAFNALRQTAQSPSQVNGQTNGNYKSTSKDPAGGQPMEDVKPTVPSITVDSVRSHTSPATSVKEMQVSPTGELPPIRQHSPQSGLSSGNSGGPITLPSITDQLGDINHLPDAHTPRDSSTFAQSPPAPPPPLFSAVPGHGSPPKSPNDFRALPSPGRGAFFYNNNPHRRPSQSDGAQYSSNEYSSSSTETPSTDHSASTPAMAIDRMSIDGITNPQIGGFQCNYPGCTAQPFQTQYLLNSHANVHSQNRPHYCSVKGCPRSESGKGFKRKNEMIRHGLVHDSPGYVCPFCPDREHKYPRPDNLQRHVRVHHLDKDKDDPQLRDVLSQRPEGPSRGRRRRGGTA